LSTTEVFDPATKRWATLDPKPVLSSFESSILLPDGRVLVVGGLSAFVGRTRAAISATLALNPTTGHWKEEQPMPTPRSQLMVASLPTGMVMAAGGMTDSDATDVVEVFDPSTGTWAKGPPLPAPRFSAQTLSLSDGRVLLIGGLGPSSTEPDPNPTIPGGAKPQRHISLNDSVVFDLKSRTWTSVAFPPANFGVTFAQSRSDGGVAGILSPLPPPAPENAFGVVPIVQPTEFIPFLLTSNLSKVVRGTPMPSSGLPEGWPAGFASTGKGSLFALAGTLASPKGLLYDSTADSWSVTDTPTLPVPSSLSRPTPYGLTGGRVIILNGDGGALYDPNPPPIRTSVRDLSMASPELSPWLTAVAGSLAVLVLLKLVWVRRPRRLKI